MNLEQDTYWQETVNLFTGTFSYFKRNGEPQPVPVRAKIHKSIEQYSGIQTEIVPIRITEGERVYFSLQPYVEEPNIDTIGTIQESKIEGFRQTPLGKCQAWYYPSDTTVVVWECSLDPAFRGKTLLLEDTNMTKLWQSIEKYFAQKFPRADRIVTPFDDPLFQREEYQAFLRSLGYEPVAKAAYGKLL